MATRKSPPARKRAPAKTQVLKPKAEGSSRAHPLVRFYLALAHGFGGAARALSPDQISKDDRRDGFPFFMAILGILGITFGWFLIQESFVWPGVIWPSSRHDHLCNFFGPSPFHGARQLSNRSWFVPDVDYCFRFLPSV
jgi:hypothetical protein